MGKLGALGVRKKFSVRQCVVVCWSEERGVRRKSLGEREVVGWAELFDQSDKENDSGTRRNKAEQAARSLMDKGLGGGTNGET